MGQALGCVTVKPSAVVVREHLGKPDKVLQAGHHFVPWCAGFKVAGSVSLSIQQLDIPFEMKTKENIFVTAVVSIQYRAEAEKASESFCMLSNANAQLKTHALHAIREAVQFLSLKDVYGSLDGICLSVQEKIKKEFSDWGYEILNTKITEIKLDDFSKQTIRECSRMKMMDDYKIQTMLCDGMGAAKQHEAILNGLSTSLRSFSENVPGTSTKDVVDIVLMNTMKAIGASSKSSALYLPLHPGAVKDAAAAAQIGESTLQAEGAGH